ncbi:MAG: ParB/RepB/Spo0J family partition protein [Defluviitaleaceae bacterium]|nr:ParB/RepB/Spo0J family partition protein [Defluviitaleaceae bacterium]
MNILTQNEIVHLNVSEIAPNPYQPRKFFDKDKVHELSQSIKEYGVMQPISVRLINGNSFELVSGERRLRATKLAGLETIPAIVINIAEKDSAALALIENIQRENLNFIEEAVGFYNLINDYKLTQEELAKRIGKSQSTIANKIRLLKLSKSTHKALLENNLTERHARALLKLDGEENHEKAISIILKNNYNVKQTEDLVERMILTNKKEINKNRKITRRIKDFKIFSNSIKESLNIMEQAGFNCDYIVEETENDLEIMIRVNKKNVINSQAS